MSRMTAEKREAITASNIATQNLFRLSQAEFLRAKIETGEFVDVVTQELEAIEKRIGEGRKLSPYQRSFLNKLTGILQNSPER